MSTSIPILDHFFPLFFPHGFGKSKKFGYWTLGSGGKKTLKWSDQRGKKSVKKIFEQKC